MSDPEIEALLELLDRDLGGPAKKYIAAWEHYAKQVLQISDDAIRSAPIPSIQLITHMVFSGRAIFTLIYLSDQKSGVRRDGHHRLIELQSKLKNKLEWWEEIAAQMGYPPNWSGLSRRKKKK